MSLTSRRSQPGGRGAPESVDGRSATPLVVGMVLLALGVVAYYAFGIPGMDHTTPTDHDATTHPSYRLIDPGAFETVLLDPATVAINVHVPASDVEIDGTDLILPFDQLDPATLPADRATPLAIYCRSGTMSTIAARRLVELGYTDVVELDGGTDAWAASGRALTTGDDD
jgi:phage shock protein E